jgi:hypothetical protein
MVRERFAEEHCAMTLLLLHLRLIPHEGMEDVEKACHFSSEIAARMAASTLTTSAAGS